MRSRIPPLGGFDFDYVMFLFTRISALAMYLLAFIAIAAALIMGARQEMTMADVLRWAFLPNPNHVINTNVPDLEVWKGLFWQGMGIAVLFFAGAHGVHGLLNVVEDYISRARLRQALRILGLLFWLIMTAVGTYVILTS